MINYENNTTHPHHLRLLHRPLLLLPRHLLRPRHYCCIHITTIQTLIIITITTTSTYLITINLFYFCFVYTVCLDRESILLSAINRFITYHTLYLLLLLLFISFFLFFYILSLNNFTSENNSNTANSTTTTTNKNDKLTSKWVIYLYICVCSIYLFTLSRRRDNKKKCSE